jgi:hypothetical protein
MTSDSDTVMRFPCEFPVKAMGLAAYDLESIVPDIVRLYAPDTARNAVSKRVSANGKYISVTVTVNAKSREQLDAIYRALTGHKHIIMAL